MVSTARTVFSAVLLLAAAVAAAAQTALTYQLATWPANDGAAAPRYHRADMTGVAVDAVGRVFMCRGGPEPVLVFDRSGNYLYSFGDGYFEEPHTVRVGPDGNVWLTDYNTHLVLEFSPAGQFVAQYGQRHRPSLAAGHFSGPNDLAWGPSGDIYVAEGDGARVVHLDRNGNWVGLIGRPGKKPGQFKFPHSIAVDAQERIYVADRPNKRVEVFDRNGNYLTLWSLRDQPYGLFITPDQRMVIAFGKSDKIGVYDLQGNQLSKWGRGGRRADQLNEPHQLCVDNQGVLWIAETGNRRVDKYLPQ